MLSPALMLTAVRRCSYVGLVVSEIVTVGLDPSLMRSERALNSKEMLHGTVGEIMLFLTTVFLVAAFASALAAWEEKS